MQISSWIGKNSRKRKNMIPRFLFYFFLVIVTLPCSLGQAETIQATGTSTQSSFTVQKPVIFQKAWPLQGITINPPPPEDRKRLSEGDTHRCVVVMDGSLRCWGQFGHMQPDSTFKSNFIEVPSPIPNLQEVQTVENFYGTCAILQDHTVWCWGRNFGGMLGDGTTIDRDEPTQVVGISNAVKLKQANGDHVCALLKDSTVKCWGGNFGLTPVTIPNLNKVKDFATGLSHYCALFFDGSVTCWGDNTFGQIGPTPLNEMDEPNPTYKVVSAGAEKIFAAWNLSCILMKDSTAQCFGANSEGQLGRGQDNSSFSTPKPVSNLNGVISLALGYIHACALLDDSTVRCWGNNDYGQLGNGTRQGSNVPNPGILSGVAEISTSGSGNCALMQNGSVKCWGKNWFDWFGVGSQEDQLTPKKIPNFNINE